MKGPTHTRSGSPRGMEAIGLDIGETNRRNLSQRRIKRGECPTCGIRTHKIGMFGKKTPLTIQGDCVYGRCLRCKPVEGYQIRPPVATLPLASEPMGVGRDIIVDIVDDDDSVVSGITMDPALKSSSVPWMPGRFDGMYDLDEEQEDMAPPPPIRRPLPSVGGDDDFHPLQTRPQHQETWMDTIGESGRSRRTTLSSSSDRRPQSRPRDIAPPSHAIPPSDVPSRRLTPHYINKIPNRLPSDIEEEESQKMSDYSSGLRKSSSSGISYPAPVTNNAHEEELHRHDNRVQHYDEEEKNEIQAPGGFHGDPWRNQDPNFMMNVSRNSRKERRHEQRRSSEGQVEISFIPDGRGHSDGRNSARQGTLAERPGRQGSPDDRAPRPTKISPQSADLQFIPDPEELVSSRKQLPPHRPKLGGGLEHISVPRERRTPSPPLHMSGDARPGQRPVRDMGGPKPFAQASAVANIPVIIRRLVSRDADAKKRGEAFRSLAEIVWSNGDEAKLAVHENHGIELVVESMWEDLGDPDVQAPAVDLIFALSACSEDSMGRDIFMGGCARNAIDALLISMQTHISLENLQRSGCGALGCLASASSENEHVDDGTLSGAVSCVVAAMDAHRKSAEVQRWGLWALYCQCVLSHNAENSQMNLAKGAIEAGGMNVIFRAMDLNESDLVALEWGCKLYWSLSFSDEIVGMLTESNRTVVTIMKVLRSFQGIAEAEATEEAAYGALANIARVKKSHSWLRESKIISRVVESMDTYHSAEGVNIEACALLSNLMETRSLKEAVLTYGVDKIFRAMETFQDSVELNEEALKVLLCLSVDSEEAKAKLTSEEHMNFIVDAIFRHRQSPSLQETGLALVASLCRKVYGICRPERCCRVADQSDAEFSK